MMGVSRTGGIFFHSRRFSGPPPGSPPGFSLFFELAENIVRPFEAFSQIHTCLICPERLFSFPQCVLFPLCISPRRRKDSDGLSVMEFAFQFHSTAESASGVGETSLGQRLTSSMPDFGPRTFPFFRWFRTYSSGAIE